jgi:spermidine synthase
MERLPGWYIVLRDAGESVSIPPFYARQLANFGLALVFLGPAAFAMGASFPLIADIYARLRHATADAVGRVTAANTLGAILGAALSGYVLVQAAGIERSIQFLVVVNGGLGLWLLATAAGATRYRVGAVALAATAAVLLLAAPDRLRVWDPGYFAVYRSNRPEVFATREMREAALRRAEVVYLAEGVSSIVSAVRTAGVLAFATNGRVEASTGFRDVQNQYALGHLPMLLHRDPRSVLVVGAGAGMTAGATTIHPSVERVTLVERSDTSSVPAAMLRCALRQDVQRVEAEYIPTAKNGIVAGLYDRLGLQRIGHNSASTCYLLEPVPIVESPSWIALRNETSEQ